MKKIIPISLLFILTCVLYFGSITYLASVEAIKIWFETLIPSLFIGLVLIRVLDEQGILQSTCKIIFFWVEPIFKISPEAFSIVFASFFLGSPSGGLLIDEYVSKGLLSRKQGQRLVNCVTVATPSFMIMTCGVVLLKSIQAGFMIWFAQILACLTLLLVTRATPINLQTLKQQRIRPLFESIRHGITTAGISLFYVGGYLLLSIVLLNIATSFLPQQSATIIKSIGEFALGCTIIAQQTFSPMLQTALICALLGFSGFSVHLQVLSLTPHLGIPYFVFLFYRCAQALISLAFLIGLLVLL